MNSVSNVIHNFINEHRSLIRTILWLFLAGIAFGGITAYYHPGLMERIVQGFVERFGENPDLDTSLAIQIFIQNLTVSIIAWLGGLFVGLAPVLVVLVNGFILGYVIAYIVLASDMLLSAVVGLTIGLLPHGIIEIPAFLLAAVLGLRLGLYWLSKSAAGNRWEIFKQSAIATFQYFLYVVLALFLAALIEVFVSGNLVNNL